jgi:hypothetical protein
VRGVVPPGAPQTVTFTVGVLSRLRGSARAPKLAPEVLMKTISVGLCYLAFLFDTAAGESATNGVSRNHVLMIEPSSTAVSGAKARLTIGPLASCGEIYTGDYQMRVSPYFFKSEKGKLAISISNENIARAVAGEVVDVTGTATTTGKNERARRIDATATPHDKNRGTLKLWFMVGEKKLTFDTQYRFVE